MGFLPTLVKGKAVVALRGEITSLRRVFIPAAIIAKPRNEEFGLDLKEIQAESKKRGQAVPILP